MVKIDFKKEIKIIELSEKGFSLEKIAKNIDSDTVTVYKIKKELNL